jgi:hypothetical protein
MSQYSISGLAMLAALTFLVMALMGCASSEQPVAQAGHDPFFKGNGVAEFHSASIGDDALRGELPSEN